MDVRDLGFSHTPFSNHIVYQKGIFKRWFVRYQLSSLISMLKEPPDFIGNILAKLINSKIASSALNERMQDWRMTVVFDTDYYPVSIYFDETISIEGYIEFFSQFSVGFISHC